MLKKWEELPEEIRTDEVKVYYDILSQKKCSLVLKRIFDVIVAFMFLVVLCPFFLILAILIKLDSPGTVFYRQVRITQYGKEFRIHKFRTMISEADKKGSLVTVGEDSRITRIGKVLRKYRLDELPQVIDILQGNMSFVGTRPEVPKYVNEYSKEMKATLLLPAGVTSLASIYYKDEAKLLDVEDADKVYIEKVLPGKMYFNLKGIEQFSFWGDIKVMFMTVFAVLGREYEAVNDKIVQIDELVEK